MIGLAVLACDVILVRNGMAAYSDRIFPPLVGLAVLHALTDGDRRSLGLTLRPEKGYLYWTKVGVVLLVAVGAILGVFFAVIVMSGREVPLYGSPPSHFWGLFVWMCVLAPLVEEMVYRFVVCTSLVPGLGGWGTILVSGALFAGLHHLYGNPSPENQVGGFFLAWAYLRSGSMVVPIAFHAIGNLVVLVGQTVAWHFITG